MGGSYNRLACRDKGARNKKLERPEPEAQCEEGWPEGLFLHRLKSGKNLTHALVVLQICKFFKEEEKK